MKITGLDHLVLTVADIGATCDFYIRLGMEKITFASGGIDRTALTFGSQKINLHLAGAEFEPKAARPTPGSADLCLITDANIDAVITHMADINVEIEEGPVPRTGALGPMTSVYLRDPDGNLIEISSYQ